MDEVGSAAKNSRTFKISWEGDMRRITCAPCFTALADTAAQRFGLPSLDGLCFQYVDPDHDLITVNSNEELLDAIALLSADCGTLRMTLAPGRSGPSGQNKHQDKEVSVVPAVTTPVESRCGHRACGQPGMPEGPAHMTADTPHDVQTKNIIAPESAGSQREVTKQMAAHLCVDARDLVLVPNATTAREEKGEFARKSVIEVPDKDVGLVIGKKGATVRMIENITGAKVQVYGVCMSCDWTGRTSRLRAWSLPICQKANQSAASQRDYAAENAGGQALHRREQPATCHSRR